MKDLPLGGEPILRPQPLDVDERTLPLAVHKVLQGRDREKVLVGKHGN